MPFQKIKIKPSTNKSTVYPQNIHIYPQKNRAHRNSYCIKNKQKDSDKKHNSEK